MQQLPQSVADKLPTKHVEVGQQTPPWAAHVLPEPEPDPPPVEPEPEPDPEPAPAPDELESGQELLITVSTPLTAISNVSSIACDIIPPGERKITRTITTKINTKRYSMAFCPLQLLMRQRLFLILNIP